MTREYREYAKSRIEYLLKISRLDERDKEALEAAIHALSQEPTIGQLFSCEEIEELRSKIWKQVEQEPKSGKWIEHPEIETSAPEYLMFYECSECGDKQCFCKSDIHKKRFCSNCGCRMVEPQERSE